VGGDELIDARPPGEEIQEGEGDGGGGGEEGEG
jgi:hypothetical protein